MIRHVTVLLLVLLARSAAGQTPGSRILVIPFENARHEPQLHWLSEGSAVLLADELRATGLGAISRTERARAFEDLRLPASATLSRATIIKVGQLVGASEVIVGSFALEGRALKVEAHSIRIDVGRLEPDVIERGPLGDLFLVFERLARRLAPDAKRTTGAGTEVRPPLDAFEHFIKGLVAESPAARATFLETAIRLHAGYDRAQLELWEVRTDQGDYAAALAAARAVGPGSRHAEHARFLAGLSLLDLERHTEAFDTFKALSTNAAAFNNLGVLQIRRGATPQTGTAPYYFTKAVDVDPADADYLFNLGYAYALERNTQAAVYWLREAVRRNPADADAHYVLAATLQSSGSTVEAAREKELARQLASRYEEGDRRTPSAADTLVVPKGLERVRTDLDTPQSIGSEPAVASSAQREQRDLVSFHLDRGRRLYDREENREALAELKRVVYLSPYEAEAHLLIGRIHVRAGRPEEAIDALKISVWSQDTAPARIALAEAYLKQQKTDAAKAELQRALVLDPSSAEAKRLLATMK